MILLEIAPSARRDLDAIFAESRSQFGERVADRYRLLVETALRDLRADPERHGVRAQPDLPGDLRIYHLRHSRLRLPQASRISRPRHMLVFRQTGDLLVIARVLHDAMDLSRHL